MKFRVEVSARTGRDIAEIAAYLDERAPEAAARWLDELEACFASLSRWPRRHRRAPEAEGWLIDVRQATVGPYRVIFEVERDRVMVLHVRHAARRPLEEF